MNFSAFSLGDVSTTTSSSTSVDKSKDAGYIRRGKLGISGKAYSTWEYKLVFETDEDDGNYDLVLDEANVTYGGFKPAKIKMGRWGNEFGLVRAAFAPVMEDDLLLHVGFSYYNSNPDMEEDAAKSKVKFANAELRQRQS